MLLSLFIILIYFLLILVMDELFSKLLKKLFTYNFCQFFIHILYTFISVFIYVNAFIIEKYKKNESAFQMTLMYIDQSVVRYER